MNHPIAEQGSLLATAMSWVSVLWTGAIHGRDFLELLQVAATVTSTVAAFLYYRAATRKLEREEHKPPAP